MSVRWYFDEQAVRMPVIHAERQVVPQMAESVRSAAARSIVARRQKSRPGEPPSSHSGRFKRLLSSAWASRSVMVVGAEQVGSGVPVPGLLEYGGEVVRQQRGKRVRMRYLARPYMRPALATVSPRFAAMWAGSVHD